MTDLVTQDFNQRCLNGDSDLLHMMNEAQGLLGEKFNAAYGERLLPRALFASKRELDGLTKDLTGLFDLLADLPERMFDGDLDRYCASVGIDEQRIRYLRPFAGRRPALTGRADLYHDGDSFKVLEFNIGSAMGGTDRAQVSDALLRVGAFRDFAGEHGLDYVHTGRRIAETLREIAAPLTGGADPVVAFVDPDDGLPRFLHLVLAFQEMMQNLGLEVVLGEVSQIREKGGRLYLHGRPIDVVLRYFSDNELAERPDGERSVEPIFRAHEEGRVVLWTGLESQLINNKGALALLADDRFRQRLTTQETALVDRVMPWTRILSEAPSEVDGEKVDLFEYCRDHRAELILKPSLAYGGAGIVVGWLTEDQQWQQALRTGVARGDIVQRRVVPRDEPIINPVTREVEPWTAVWDAFLTPSGYAGSHIRAVPKNSDDPVIRMGAAAAHTTGIFYYPG
ncbi:hypothetical protein [Streptomyces sp. NBC_00829]|uniref:hypothetical protein n=1 Tax=Streptomyces sp. NBC_00829 TaxID=2903679 RepID=UPI00386C935B|nr:hypothetical protein OG293_01840 [Streptomyces sp. NBC_00829]